MFADAIVSCTNLVIISFLFPNETYVPLSKELQNKSGGWMCLSILVRQIVNIQTNLILGSAHVDR